MPAHHRPQRTRRRRAATPRPAPGAPPAPAAPAPPAPAPPVATANPLAAALSMLLANAHDAERHAASAEAAKVPSHPAVTAPGADAAADALEVHTLHLHALLGQARRIAQLMLDRMEQRLVAGEEVYPREFVHVCRGLQLLGKTGAELAKAAASRPAAGASGADAAADGGGDDDDDCGLTPEQRELLEAEVRLWEAQRAEQAQAQDDAFRASHPGHALGDVRRPAAP